MEGCNHIGEPANKAFPCGTLFVFFLGEQCAVFLVIFKHTAQFVGCFFVKDKGIYFVIVTQTPAI